MPLKVSTNFHHTVSVVVHTEVRNTVKMQILTGGGVSARYYFDSTVRANVIR